MEKKEIMSFTEFNSQTVSEDYDSTQLDLKNPASIINYGDDVLEKFEQLKDCLPVTFVNDDYKDYEFSDPIKNIERFNETLSKEEPKKGAVKSSKFVSGIAGALNRVSRGKIDILGVNESYTESYMQYIENIKQICKQMIEDKASLEGDIKYFNNFKKYIEHLNEQLMEYIVEGEETLKKAKDNVDNLSEEEVETAKLYINVAEDRLLSLKNASETMKILCGQIDLKNAGAMSQKTKYDEYLQITAPTISLYAGLAVGVKRDAKRIERLQKTREVVNDTMVKTSLKLTENITAVGDLDKDSLITLDTLKDVASQFEQGARILEAAQLDKERNKLNILSSFEHIDGILKHYKATIDRAILGLEEDSQSDFNGLDSPSHTKTKRIGK